MLYLLLALSVIVDVVRVSLFFYVVVKILIWYLHFISIWVIWLKGELNIRAAAKSIFPAVEIFSGSVQNFS